MKKKVLTYSMEGRESDRNGEKWVRVNLAAQQNTVGHFTRERKRRRQFKPVYIDR